MKNERIVKEDEMIISRAEYDEMKKEIDNLRGKESLSDRIRNNLYDEVAELKSKVEKLEKENHLLKNGIANFVKIMGGKT